MGEQNAPEIVIETGRVNSELYEDLVVRWPLERCPSFVRTRARGAPAVSVDRGLLWSPSTAASPPLRHGVIGRVKSADRRGKCSAIDRSRGRVGQRDSNGFG